MKITRVTLPSLPRFILMALFLAAGLGMAGARADEIVDRANGLTRQGNPAAAFALLEPLEPKRAGEIDFDYALGTAALDSGKLDRATIAFERILAVDPNFAGARLDLGRALFAMGSDDLAKNEFETVLQQNPPAAVRPLIEKYLEAIAARKKKDLPALSFYVEGGLGHDSNITAVTSGDFSTAVLAAYAIPAVLPTGNSILRKGPFGYLGGGVDYARPLQDVAVGLGLYAGADVKARNYWRDNDFNSQQLDARAGLSYTMERDLVRLGLQAQRFQQEAAAPLSPATGTKTTNDRSMMGLSTEWRRALAPGMQAGLFAQFNQTRFSTSSTQDINSAIFGGQFVKAWDTAGKPVLVAAAYQSRDKARGPQNAAATTDVSKTITGLRLYGQYTVREQVDLFATAGHSARRDDSQFSRSLVEAYGKDRTLDYALGVNWRFTPEWTLRAQAAHFDNRSNISLYEYKRDELSINIRRDFK